MYQDGDASPHHAQCRPAAARRPALKQRVMSRESGRPCTCALAYRQDLRDMLLMIDKHHSRAMPSVYLRGVI